MNLEINNRVFDDSAFQILLRKLSVVEIFLASASEKHNVFLIISPPSMFYIDHSKLDLELYTDSFIHSDGEMFHIVKWNTIECKQQDRI